jgi:iron complex outermembrane receptor protein
MRLLELTIGAYYYLFQKLIVSLRYFITLKTLLPNSRIYKKTHFSFLLLVIACSVYGEEGVTISGKIVNERSESISDAYVYFLNTNFATFSDKQGNFTINNVPAGEYTISVSAIGYASVNEKLFVTKDFNSPLVFHLADAVKQLGEIIVTAQKEEQNAQQVPFSLSVLPEKLIDQYRLWKSKDMTAIIPNLLAANPGDGRNVISIRGITSTSYDPAVTTYIDGVSQFTLDTYIPELFDISRIEVLRGPQGTLYGRNSMGGVINIITKQPTDKTEVFAEAGIGNYQASRYCAGMRLPVIKHKLFFGVAALYEDMNGYYFNTYTNKKFDRQYRFGSNYYLKYIASSKWTIMLNLKQLANRNFGAFPLAPSLQEAFSGPFKVNQNAVGKLVDNTINSSLSVNYTLRHFMVSSQSAYQSNYRYYRSPIDADFSPIDGVTIINDYGHKWNKVKVVTQEFKISSVTAPSRIKFVAGVFIFYQEAPNKQATHFGKDAALVGSPDSNYAIINTTTIKDHGVSLYAQSTYEVSNKTDIIAGLRYDYQRSDENILGEYQPDTSPAPIFQTQPDTSAGASYGAFSPKVSIAFHPVANMNFYISYSRGYRTGGLTQLSLDPSQPPLYAYKPEYSDNFEIGSKNTFFKNQLRANISIFYSSITNAQVPTLILPDAITVTKNAGRLSSKGIETELAATLLKGLEANWNFGYTHARYTRLNLSQNGSVTDLAGKRQVFTPDMTSMLVIQYSIPVNKAHSIKLVVRGEWAYLGTTYFDFNNTIRQSPYNLFNSGIGILMKHFEVRLWGRNMANKKYISYAYDFGAVHLGDPKTYGITVKAMF